MSRQVRLYPYAVSEQLALTLSDFDDPATGTGLEVREVKSVLTDDGDAPTAGYDLASVGAWEKVSVRLTAQLTEDELFRVVPKSSNLLTDVELIVGMTCRNTRYRHAVSLEPRRAGHWTGFTTVQRSDLRGELALRPQLVRKTSIPADGSRGSFARSSGAVIATGTAVKLYVDAAPRMDLGAIPMAWEDFANSANTWRREHPADVYHLEPYGQEPVLYLNSRYAELQELLDVAAKTGPQAVLRDLTATLIAQTVWGQLAFAAMAGVTFDEATGTGAADWHGWRGTVLRHCLSRLCSDEGDPERALNRLALELSEPDGRLGIASKIGSMAQDMAGSYKAIEGAVRAFEAGQAESGEDE